jgi:Cu-processing system ATP-binding protein
VIVVENLSKTFGRLTALSGVSLTCRQGECVALIGPNASGKTTLTKCLLGLTIPDSGIIRFNGEPVARDFHYRQHIGYMPQIARFPENMTIGQVFAMIRDIRKKSKPKMDEDLFARFGLEAMLNKRMRTLSGGTRQKVSAALAFLFDADVYLLDEPTAGLDPLSAEILKDKITREMKQGKLILITSHVLSELDQLVSEVIYLQEGKLRFHKTIDALRRDTEQINLSRAIASVMRNN